MTVIKVRGADRPEVAAVLLAAAESLGLEPRVVRSLSDGYDVPPEVLSVAGMASDDTPPPDVPPPDPDDPPPPDPGDADTRPPEDTAAGSESNAEPRNGDRRRSHHRGRRG